MAAGCHQSAGRFGRLRYDVPEGDDFLFKRELSQAPGGEIKQIFDDSNGVLQLVLQASECPLAYTVEFTCGADYSSCSDCGRKWVSQLMRDCPKQLLQSRLG